MGNVVVGSKLMHGVVFEIGSEDIVVNGQNSNALVAVNGYTGVCGLTRCRKKPGKPSRRSTEA
jgi:hypothetical protein